MQQLTWPEGLNVATRCFSENRTQGLMICGLEWGGPSDGPPDAEDGFFSQAGVNAYPYRSRLLGWFELFGHRLETDPNRAGPFERSILQTNWLTTQSRRMGERDPFAECINAWPAFELRLREIEPRLIIFLSVTLLHALNTRPCLDGAKRLFGTCAEATFVQRDVPEGGRLLRRFVVGFQEFEKTSVIALPHPTQPQGVSNNYLRAFKDDIGSRIQRFKVTRGFAA